MTTIRVVRFYAPWCEDCRKLEDIYDDLIKLYEYNLNIIFNEVNSDFDIESCDDCGVFSIPVIIIYVNNAQFCRIDGLRTKEYLISKIDEAIKYVEKQSQ